MTAEEKEKNKIDNGIRHLLSRGITTSKEIISALKLDWPDSKMKNYLRKMLDIEEIKIKNKIYFKSKTFAQQSALVFEDEVPYSNNKDINK